MIDQSVGLIAHLPLNAILKGEQGVEFQLVTVELERGHVAADTLRHLLDLNLNDCFTVAAPLPPDVERRGGGDATHGSETSPPPTLDDWRQQALTWDTKRTEAFKLYRDANGITGDATDAEKLYAYNMFDQEYHFHDVETTPAVRPVAEPAAPVVQLPTNPDEGPDVDDQGTYKALEQRYMALDVAGRQWITDITKQAAAAGTPISMGAETGRRTVRRWEILRGLVALADGFDNDDALRGCVGAAIGYELADSMAFSHGQLVGCMNAREAFMFARWADALAEGGASMSFDDNGRCRVAA